MVAKFIYSIVLFTSVALNSVLHLSHSKTHNNNSNLATKNSTAMFKVLKTLHPGGFEPTIFCSVGGDDDHYECKYTTPPGLY
jgi:hypothetical protein